MSRLLLWCLGLGIGVTLVAAVIWRGWLAGESLQRAERLMLAGDFRRAEVIALRVAERSGEQGPALALAFQAAQRDGRLSDAVGHLERISDESPLFLRYAVEAADLAVHQLREFTRAERLLERAARGQPDDLAVLERRAFLFGLTGRSQRAEPLRLEMVRRGERVWTMLWLLCLGDDALENTELLAEVDESTDDPLTLFAVARWQAERGAATEARALLTRALDRGAPVEAVVLTGRLAREADDGQQLDQLLLRSTATDDAPGLWWLRGVWCEAHGQGPAAVRCYAEAVRLQPNHSRSLIPLARLLEADGQAELALRLRSRAADLALYLNAIKAVRQEAQRPQWERVVALARQLSLATEAAGWWSMGRPEWQTDPQLNETRAWIENVRTRSSAARVLPEAQPLQAFDWTRWPLPVYGSEATRSPTAVAQERTEQGEATGIRWVDVATETGLEFVFEPVPGQTTAGPRMFEFTGGGVAVFDFDRDGWLDSWWTQGMAWAPGATTPPTPDSAGPVDRLFHNRRGVHWDDITQSAFVLDTGFAQGVAAGDLNGDGFAEVVVANIGETVVHWNRGDGTFAMERLPVASGWSTSVAIADLTDDGLPDVYVVRYLGGPEIFTRTCPDAAGHPHSCLPQHFPAASDVVLQNNGDGTFRDATQSLGFHETDGKGLGIAIADFSGDGRLDVFVANDTTPNFCWVRQAADSLVPYRDEGLANGLALNGEGRAQADMGIAVDDADGNGLLDLFVTKFYNETNTLSLQVEPGVFLDATSGSGLGDSSLRLLGFGTRFVDADLDGRPDLIITNGHIDDARHRGEPYAMRPQFYQNRGEGRFRELLAGEIGPAFGRETLGRGMAKGDWNHDGREDVFVSHIGSPASLLENRTKLPANAAEQPGWVSIELVGVSGAREPIGAVITLTAGERRNVKVLTAGDGYQASDPRRITFGLGAATTIDDVTVRWPSGQSERVQGIVPGRRWVVIEGRGSAIDLATDSPLSVDR